MEFKELIDKVRQFNTLFEVPMSDKPVLLDFSEYNLRFNLMSEENSEYFEACNKNDLIEVADALGDKLYILLGTILKHGMQDKILEAFNLIHENNMSKLHDGKVVRNEAGKIIKPANFQPVDLTKIFNNE